VACLWGVSKPIYSPIFVASQRNFLNFDTFEGASLYNQLVEGRVAAADRQKKRLFSPTDRR
jgi:hypothetical protein